MRKTHAVLLVHSTLRLIMPYALGRNHNRLTSRNKADKALVLCQHGSQGTPLACASRRRRSDLLYLGRAVTTGPYHRGTALLLRRSAYLHVASLVMVCAIHVCRSRPAPHHVGLCPRRPRFGPHTSGLEGACTHPLHAAARGMAARGVVQASQARPPPARARHGGPRERRYGIPG
jgi:hypothetical protein